MDRVRRGSSLDKTHKELVTTSKNDLEKVEHDARVEDELRAAKKQNEAYYQRIDNLNGDLASARSEIDRL